VENLEGCTSLQELHLSRQRLPAGVELAFDPNCLEVCPGEIGDGMLSSLLLKPESCSWKIQTMH